MLREAIRKVAPRGAQIAQGKSLPAPVEGWDASSPLADMSPLRAIVLDNWYPTPTDVRVRRGNTTHIAGVGSGRVDSLMPYEGTTVGASKLFAAGGSAIYDATSGASASAVVTGLSGAQFQFINFTTTGGKFLWACNGTDSVRHYDGSSWAVPSLTISPFTSADIINAAAHKNRIWVVFKNSTVAGYLPTGAIAGTVTNFELGGLFTKGGYLVAIGTWTRDGGAGEDDLAAFLSSEGQVAVYAGTDPASASTWALVGVYDIAPPIGLRCLTKLGGDLAIITIDGVLPLSEALRRERGGTAAIALTKRIRNAMNETARLYDANFGWQFIAYPRGGYALLNVPIQAGVTQNQYVMNTETGAWCRFLGQNANCWAVFNDDLYFGANDGSVRKADSGPLDITTPIVASGKCAYNYFGAPGLLKEFKLLQAILTTDSDLRPALGISTDYRDNAHLGTPTAADTDDAAYDDAKWDQAIYPVEDRTVADWVSLSGEGYNAAIHFEAQIGSITGAVWGSALWGSSVWAQSVADEIDLRLNGFNIVYEKGLVL